MLRSPASVITALILALNAPGCSWFAEPADDASAPTTTAVTPRLSADMATLDVLGADPQFWTFLELAERAGIADDLEGEPAGTIIAPSSGAFTQMDPAALDALMADTGSALRAVQIHTIAERLDYEALQDRVEVETVAGVTLPVVATDETVTVGGATITKHDIETRNAVIHVVDAVIDFSDS